MNKKVIYSLLGMFLIAAIILVGLVLYFSFRHEPANKQQSVEKQAGGQSQSAIAGTPSTTPSKTYPVKVYFSKHPESDNDPGNTFAVQRTSPDAGVAKYAINQLLKGPTATESAKGYFTTTRLRQAVSTCAGADFTLSINDGTATLKFCKPFDHLGVVADGQADSEIKSTLKQFTTVKKVVILNYRGSCEFDLSGMNLCLQQ